MKHLTETPPDLPTHVSWPIPEPHALRSTETVQSDNKHRKKNQLLLLLAGMWKGTWGTGQERDFSWKHVFESGGVWAGSSAHAHALL